MALVAGGHFWIARPCQRRRHLDLVGVPLLARGAGSRGEADEAALDAGSPVAHELEVGGEACDDDADCELDAGPDGDVEEALFIMWLVFFFCCLDLGAVDLRVGLSVLLKMIKDLIRMVLMAVRLSSKTVVSQATTKIKEMQHPNLQNAQSKHDLNAHLLLPSHLQSPNLRSRQYQHPQVQSQRQHALGNGHASQVDAAAGLGGHAVEAVPEPADGPALQHADEHKGQGEQDVEELGGPQPAAEAAVGEDAKVEEADGHFDDAEGDGVEELKGEEELHDTEDVGCGQAPGVDAQS